MKLGEPEETHCTLSARVHINGRRRSLLVGTLLYSYLPSIAARFPLTCMHTAKGIRTVCFFGFARFRLSNLKNKNYGTDVQF